MAWKSALWGVLLGICSAATLLAQDAKKPHVVFICGEDEYRSDVSMPMIAKILEAKHGMKCSLAMAKPNPQSKERIDGLEALTTADLAVFFIRVKAIPEEQFKFISDYIESGKPVVGLRTSTHAFQYPKESDLHHWNYEFGPEVFGQKWLRANVRTSSTNVSIANGQASNPILRGIPSHFHVRSWLYQVLPLHGECVELLNGDGVTGTEANGTSFGMRNPVAWTKQRKQGRTFFTSLGHPQDFEQEAVRRLLINGIYWSLGKEIPAGGTNADIQGTYVAPKVGA